MHMGPKYITLPKTEEAVKDKINFFSAHGVPQCLGAIDGTHRDQGAIVKPNTLYKSQRTGFS